MKIKTKNGYWKNTLSRKEKKRYKKLFNENAFIAVSMSNEMDYVDCGIINKFSFER